MELIIFIAAFCAAAASGVLAGVPDLTGYANHTLEASIDYLIYTKADATHLYMILKADNQGWLGFGFAEQTSGHMKGSDILTVTIASSGDANVQDRYADFAPLSVNSEGNPSYSGLWASLDANNDFTHLSTMREGNTTYISVQRKLTTGDYQDRDIEAGFRRVVWAWGPKGTAVGYHGSNRGAGEIDLLGGATRPLLISDGAWERAIPSYAIPSGTTYAEMAFELDISQARHIVGLDVIVAPHAAGMVHHITLHAYESKTDYLTEIWETPKDKKSVSGNKEEGKTGLFYAWAVGMRQFVLPEEAGLKVSSAAGDLRYIVMQVHYDNPKGTVGVVDTTSVVLHYSDTLRPNDAWMLTLGDPQTAFNFVRDNAVNDVGPLPINTENVHRIGTCPSECTQYLNQNIKLINSFLHMHYYGHKIYTDLYDEAGTFLKTISRIDYWDNAFQSGQIIDVDVQPGMTLQTHCHYNTKAHGESIGFGESTDEEMCMEFLLYYPRQADFQDCGYGPLGTKCDAAPNGFLFHSTQSSLVDGGYQDPSGFLQDPNAPNDPPPPTTTTLALAETTTTLATITTARRFITGAASSAVRLH